MFFPPTVVGSDVRQFKGMDRLDSIPYVNRRGCEHHAAYCLVGKGLMLRERKYSFNDRSNAQGASMIKDGTSVAPQVRPNGAA